MGIDFHVLAFLNSIEHKNFGSTLTIGRQSVHIHKSDLKLLKKLGIVQETSKLEENIFVDSYLLSEFGSKSVESMDISNYEGASIQHDLNIPVPQNLIDRFDTIIDSGSLEHVFNTNQAFENLINMCRIGGRIIHIAPSDNFSGHGFWQISPELYFSLYSADNGFELEKVVIASLSDRKRHFNVFKPSHGHRITLFSHSPIYVMTVARKIAKVNRLKVWQSDYRYVWTNYESNSINPKIIKETKGLLEILISVVKRIKLLTSPSKNFGILNERNEYISSYKIKGE